MTELAASPPRRSWFKALIPLALAVLVTGASLSVYFAERDQGRALDVLGDNIRPDRLDVQFFVQKVDPAAEEVAAQVLVEPQGKFADENGFPSQDITLYTSAIKGDTLTFKLGKSPSVADVRVPMSSGVITDYPFDSYTAEFGFYAETANESVPVSVTFSSSDSFFGIRPHSVRTDDDVLAFVADADRKVGNFAFALFIMVFMWCLSVAALIAAWFAIKGRHGLLWASMSFMGALLFALVPLRNAVPGQPPIGSIVDFAAFFIAEALISLSLITTVVAGYRIERRKAALASTPS